MASLSPASRMPMQWHGAIKKSQPRWLAFERNDARWLTA
jgi:hypothetical protein